MLSRDFARGKPDNCNCDCNCNYNRNFIEVPSVRNAIANRNRQWHVAMATTSGHGIAYLLADSVHPFRLGFPPLPCKLTQPFCVSRRSSRAATAPFASFLGAYAVATTWIARRRRITTLCSLHPITHIRCQVSLWHASLRGDCSAPVSRGFNCAREFVHLDHITDREEPTCGRVCRDGHVQVDLLNLLAAWRSHDRLAYACLVSYGHDHLG